MRLDGRRQADAIAPALHGSIERHVGVTFRGWRFQRRCAAAA
jgi:hypothetical protein